MRKKKTTLTICAAALALAFAAAMLACSANSSARSDADRAKSLLNARQFGEAVRILEDRHRSSPDDQGISLLLAQAHLGAAGIELFDFVSQVFGKQPPGDELDLFMQPDCGNGAIERLGGSDFRCLALRILKRIPEADDPHLARARAVLRADFAEPAKAATDVNFLAAFVELGSAFARLKVLLKRSLVLEIQTDASLRPADLPFELVIHHLKRFFTELTNGFTRARYSYGKVSKFVVGYQGKPLVKIQNHTFVFSEEIGLTSIARFALDVLHDNSYTVNYDINHFIQQNLQGMGAGVVRVLHVLDRVQFQEGFTDRLRIAFHFQTAFSRLLGRLADDPGSFAQVDVFTLLIGTPPAILRELGHSFQKSWDEEDGAHLRRYLETTKGQWNQLNGLLVDWEEWSKTKLTGDQQAAILAYVKTLQSEYPDVFAAPVHLDSDSLRDYQAKAIAFADHELKRVLNGEVPSVPAVSRDARDRALELLVATERWIGENLYPVR